MSYAMSLSLVKLTKIRTSWERGVTVTLRPKKQFHWYHFASFILTICLLVSSADTNATFANSLAPDQDGQNVEPDLKPKKLFDTLMVFLK